MFYRINDNRVFDYANFKFASECLFLEGVTAEEYKEDEIKYQIKDGVLVDISDTEEYQTKHQIKLAFDKINKLEAQQTPRLMREYGIDSRAGKTAETSYAIEKVERIDAEIAIQRKIIQGNL